MLLRGEIPFLGNTVATGPPRVATQWRKNIEMNANLGPRSAVRSSYLAVAQASLDCALPPPLLIAVTL
jgi:hypothetical protein